MPLFVSHLIQYPLKLECLLSVLDCIHPLPPPLPVHLDIVNVTSDYEFYETAICYFRQRFVDICSKKEKVPGMTVMKDVAIAKSEFRDDEAAITKIQDFQFDDELFDYCQLPEVRGIII